MQASTQLKARPFLCLTECVFFFLIGKATFKDLKLICVSQRKLGGAEQLVSWTWPIIFTHWWETETELTKKKLDLGNIDRHFGALLLTPSPSCVKVELVVWQMQKKKNDLCLTFICIWLYLSRVCLKYCI